MVWPSFLPAAQALLGGPYSGRYGTSKTRQGEGWLSALPLAVLRQQEFGISAKAAIDMPCCEEVGFLGAGPANEQNRHSQLRHNAAVWGGFWGKHRLIRGRAWGCLVGSGLSFSYIDYHSCFKTREQIAPAEVPPK